MPRRGTPGHRRGWRGHRNDGQDRLPPIGAASSASRVPAARPRRGRATERRCSPAASTISVDAANTLDPFAMRPAFPASDYYGSSVPPRRHQPTTGLPADQLAAGREGDRRDGSHVHSRTLRRGRRPAMPLQHRHGYAAALRRGLPAGDITQPRSSPHDNVVRVRAALRP
jgi:hypothetical protein